MFRRDTVPNLPYSAPAARASVCKMIAYTNDWDCFTPLALSAVLSAQ